MINTVSKLWLRALFIALAGDVCFALFIRANELSDFVHGARDRATIVAVVGLGWQAVVLVLAAVVAVSWFTARRDLFSRQQALAAVASTSTDWLWESDNQHRLTYSSAGVTALLGYEPGELIGRSAISLMPEGQWESAERLFRQSAGEGKGWDGIDLAWVRADGSEVVLTGNAAALTDEQGRVIGFRGTRRAITGAEIAERVLAGARQRVAAVLAAEDVTVAMQPIVDMTYGRLVGVEALARFSDGRSPDLWFREAADVGRGLDLDRLAFRRALAQLPLLPASCYLSANATPEYVLSGLLTDDVLSSGAPLHRLVIEITEHARVDDYQDLQAVLTPLRERGVRLAVDDTGAGYASLTHVLNLRPSIIKIDRSLITNIANDAARRSLVTALVLLALDLDAAVTGEGIETASELQTLAALGVDSGQGYLLGRPGTNPSSWQEWGSRNWLYPPAATTTTVTAPRN